MDQVDDYHGVKVADPYRWMKDIDAADTRAWVEAKHHYLAAISQRVALRERLRQLWDYQRYTPCEKHGSLYA